MDKMERMTAIWSEQILKRLERKEKEVETLKRAFEKLKYLIEIGESIYEIRNLFNQGYKDRIYESFLPTKRRGSNEDF